ncbi:midasin [Coniochaeta ligniaria NRRL 30616]|uniref:Midasin n=1 Tax=Coniochaeta ligniaria NRRL 30616 TaxID=1408157 RepID=A0A1J7JVS5_9PEZI|nr:midasin [Coniochaeta ligniaria NRRL 30616]
MAMIDVNPQRDILLSDATILGQLPPELLHVIQNHQASNFLDAVAAAALIPTLTGRVFACCDAVFADICARWILSSPHTAPENVKVISAFARILPFAPYLSVYLRKYLRSSVPHGDVDVALPGLDLDRYEETELRQLLLAVWRLNSFDRREFSGLLAPTQTQALLSHANPSIRYLAIRIFCQQLDAADFKLDALIHQHIQEDESLIADLDGQQADFTFLSLYEHGRAKEVQELRAQSPPTTNGQVQQPAGLQKLTPWVVSYGETVFPRPLGPGSKASSLVYTPTTIGNLERLASRLQNPGPILLHGVSGSGKTSLVQEVARELGKDDGLVTLHLNDQTDAKVLLGLYTTDSKPGSFQWRPGVLTTAVKEGRWVLIEDLDRAPTELMSTLLPLVERGELLIPSRGEVIRASDDFRIFATVRTSLGMNGQENLPSLIGMRLWQLLSVQPLAHKELRDIILGSHPLLHKYLDNILSVYHRLLSVTTGSSAVFLGRGVAERPTSTRDLLKWCRRLDHVLAMAGCKTGDEPVSDTVLNWMFMEAVDCFVSSVKEPATREHLIAKIAEEMHLSGERVQHYLNAYIPKLDESESLISVGRVQLRKTPRPTRMSKSKRPFAATTHAKRLLEQIAIGVKLKEPVLLVGETGIGKTTVVQQLAESLGHKLVAVNLSQQSEASDLLGGFKPVNSRSLAVPLKEEFEDLFEKTGVSAEKNQEYLERIAKKFARGRWSEVSKEWRKAPKMFETIVSTLQKSKSRSEEVGESGEQPAKRRKTDSGKLPRLLKLKRRWDAFSQNLDQFDRQIASGSGSFAFAFVEGNIVKAARNGDWVLLDEINLATPDTLETIADLLHSGSEGSPSILLSETGEIERITAHPDFRVFGAMNPATDVGKRDLPLGLRSRFTEIYVSSPDKDKKDLLTIIKTYLKGNNSRLDQLADSVADLYLEIKNLAESKMLVDGANEVPHFSLRTLTRVLTYANDVAPFYGIERALYEGFSMGFLTLLSQDSEKQVLPRIHKYLLKRPNILSQPPKRPIDGKEYVSFKNQNKDHQYWLRQGAEARLDRPDYIITPYVERNLLNLVRATSTRRYPVLIQGPTSAGKTSMIEFLANFTGNKFVRINNHEHTDLQEYLGTYVSGSDGKLKFQEGILVQAMRQGSWIVLDELNLAPTDVLEALNRLLDENRELLIPETQEVVRPHENFMLFATQNPAGLYGGRKVLSRAFRNRFLELHFDDIPENELETILQQRSKNTAPSDCRRIVMVYKQLTRLRQESRVFEQKNSFATLRDLFRWALRDADTREQIASNGYMLLAERVRKDEEREEVRKVIEEVFKVNIDPDVLYGVDSSPALRSLCGKENSQGVVWTKAMRRLYVLVSQAIRNNEPVLLIGETGCGKTTVCQLLAEACQKELHIVNAHQNTETGDLIGSQRPVRNRGGILEAMRNSLIQAADIFGHVHDSHPDQLLEWYQNLSPTEKQTIPATLVADIDSSIHRSKALFEWCDGSLVQAMRLGQFFLLDEISLADDSVLERLNSVLEPQRSLLLAEKGIDDSFVKATDGFQFFATMNPGGDFGKKELSPALRNRFTEIWVPAFSDEKDVLDIVSSKLSDRLKALSGTRKSVAQVVVEFSYWFGQTFRPSSATAFSLRDILAWVKFMNQCASTYSSEFALLHGASTIFIDTLGANPSALLAVNLASMDAQRQLCLDKLSELAGCNLTPLYRQELEITVTDQYLTIGDFSIERSKTGLVDKGVEFQAPTTKMNAMRVIRALHVNKPVLLEGSPGVGKTTLVSALAKACGRPLTRINLSDQTDLMDLFGTDVPVEGAEAGNFAWKDAPFLKAMQNGDWVLLDEMNLASQSVLEGLNACLDHRGEVYISELDQVFKRHPDFRLFAAQNPHHQGGGRKGLPSSFVNRFIVVYADVFTEQDLLLIAQARFGNLDAQLIRRMIKFISNLDDEVVSRKSFGSQGSPWEFNLRDTLRWLELLGSSDPLLGSAKPDDLLDIVIRQRFRTERDRKEVTKLFESTFEKSVSGHTLYHDINNLTSQVGFAVLPRSLVSQQTQFPAINAVPRLREIESIIIAIKQDLPCILVGPSGSGKSVLLRHVAALAGKELVVFPLNADVDTMDLIGGFEQADPHRDAQTCLQQLRVTMQEYILSTLPKECPAAAVGLMSLLAGSPKSTLQHLERTISCIDQLLRDVSISASLASSLSAARAILSRPLTLENPRFEWLDGVIVRAIERGQWLVLDNANLCSASVLDRLNSLLERPDGFLSINEHSGPDGEPRIVRPHPNFRVFLTMDPRYGELSRAMRNRSIEIYVEPIFENTTPYLEKITRVEADLQRYHTVQEVVERQAKCGSAQEVSPYAFDLVSVRDMGTFEKYGAAVEHGLFNSANSTNGAFLDRVKEIAAFFRSKATAPILSSYISHLQRLYAVHPLQNPTTLSLTPGNADGTLEWLALCYEYQFEVQTAQQHLEFQVSQAKATKPSLLNRFQRSYASDQVAIFAKDSTVNVSRFLVSIIRSLEIYLKEHLETPGSWTERRIILRNLLHYWQRTLTFVLDSSFDEARFQAHLSQGLRLWNDDWRVLGEPDINNMAASVLQRLEDDFDIGFKLSTGLSMEAIWTVLRPQPIRDVDALGQVLDMESLAARFDALKWRAGASVPDLSAVLTALARAYAVIRKNGLDAAGLVKELTTEIASLESRIGENSKDRRPFLATSFEALRQAHVLHQLTEKPMDFGGITNIIVLSELPTLAQMRLHSSTGQQATTFQAVGYMLEQPTEVHPWTGLISESLLLKFDSITSATLFELGSLEEELGIMAKALPQASEVITTDPLNRLATLLCELIQDIIGAHGEAPKAYVSDLYALLLQTVEPNCINITSSGIEFKPKSFPTIPEPASTEHPQFTSIFKQHIVPALLALAAWQNGVEPKTAYMAVAWVQFAHGCIKLYVPDKIFDPYLRAQVELDFHQELYNSLNKKLAGLREFECMFTGEPTSLRCELLEDEIKVLGEPPSSTETIYRPTSGELSRLQGEFVNVLNALVQNDVSSAHFRCLSGVETDGQELQLVKDNVSRLIERFSGYFNAYQDMTMPLVNFLRCLQIGLSLTDGAMASLLDEDEEDSEQAELLKVTPFLGGKPWNTDETLLSSPSLEALSFISTFVSIEGSNAQVPVLPNAMRRALFECLAFYHDEWSKKLQADRKAEESKQSLYRFRGSFEDEEELDEEEFNELFPDYSAEDDQPQTKGAEKKDKVRDLSILLADAHEKIFISPGEPTKSLQVLCKQVARKIAKENAHASARGDHLDAALYPATLLVLDEQLNGFRSTVKSSMYNFYTEPNLGEARKLLTLVTNIKSRFQDLQKIDEIGHHQTLADVITACDKLFEMRVDEPLAKLITPLEYLYAFLYEWQEGGWASRDHKATPLYEKFTNTIIDWRRLELASWARLFDMEEEKCRHDAKSWWFIAYGAIIFEPCSRLQQGQKSLENYAVEVLDILGSYFADAITGQFIARLSLVKQLKSHLDLLVQDAPALSIIRDAIENFISLYSRYEKKAVEAIRKGRETLDRKMKDVLLLFSWQDRNINALRESSTRSHQKLFRLVRKFRAVLGQSMQAVIAQGLPEEQPLETVGLSTMDTASLLIDGEAAALCLRASPELANDSHWTRLSNPKLVIKIMNKLGSLPQSVIEAPEVLDTFVTDLLSDMVALRKETPGLLTDENKDQVKHLKSRKVALFVETLKAVRQMGFSRNLSTKLLSNQDSTAVVLVKSGVITGTSGLQVDGIEYYYHKTLDLASKVRNAAHDHHADLSREAIERSIGFLEGILFTMIQQRQHLCESVRSLEALDGAITNIRELSRAKETTELPVYGIRSNVKQVLLWLPHVIQLGSHLVYTHSKLGGDDNKIVLDFLGKWNVELQGLLSDYEDLAQLPSGFSTPKHAEVQARIVESLNDRKATLRDLALARPDLAFVFHQIQNWTHVDSTVVNNTSDTQPSEFIEAVMRASKKILVAMQEIDKASQTLPSTAEDAAWLTNYNDGLLNRIKSLRIDSLAREVSGFIDLLKGLSDLSDSSLGQSVTALLRVALPLLQQYQTVCRRNIFQFADLHRATCRMGYNLSNSFVQIGTNGFCQPQEKSDEKSGDSGQLESGTGLGDGEGAEDISKDIQPDEDMTELAQEPNEKKDGDIEDQEDAVDMGMDDMEGDVGSVGEKEEDKSGDEDGEENEMDEEAGDVDDLDPTAVDEKMWDGDDDKDEADKDQQGDKNTGQKKEDEQVGADDPAKRKDEKIEEGGEQGEENNEDEAGHEQDEEVKPQEELNNQDQNVQDQETLALPDDMEIDVDDEGSEAGSEDDLDKLDDADDKQDELEDLGSDGESVEGDEDNGEAKNEDDEKETGQEEDVPDKLDGEEINPDMDVDQQDQEQPEDAPEEQPEEQPNKEDTEKPLDESTTDHDNAAPSDVKTGGGQADTEMDGQDDNDPESKAAQREHGEVGENSTDQETAEGNKGQLSQADQEHTQPEDSQAQDSREAQPFKKLGDALERWYRNQKDIAAAEEQQSQNKEMTADELAKSEFQHLQDEDAPADTQAMGGASDDEVKPFDDSMAIDNDTEETQNQVLPEGVDEEEMQQDDAMDVEQAEPQDQQKPDREDGRSGVATRQGGLNKDDNDLSPEQVQQQELEDEQVEETSTQLSSTHLTERPLRDFHESLDLWTKFQTKTHPFSLSLTSQLRLILTPSQSTKLSGSFRTGKRLNIKKIIPYIASSYKRDKIWMRRSIPTKRSYQILLCVDDSRSMGESASGALALESLVMVSRSLAMLEAGQIGVLGFGSDVFVAHDLAAPEPFASAEAGAKALQKFSFAQEGTDVIRLLRETIDRFREARLRNLSSGSEDLWQLALILSDGLTPSGAHAKIRPLLREAMEERIMVVFIIMDDAGKKKGDSVLELKEAKFTSGGNVVIERYLDSFPFQYYLIVHHLGDLPSALSGLLRTWFAEVNS